MISAMEDKKYRAENDAYIISQYLEIIQDKERVMSFKGNTMMNISISILSGPWLESMQMKVFQLHLQRREKTSMQ